MKFEILNRFLKEKKSRKEGWIVPGREKLSLVIGFGSIQAMNTYVATFLSTYLLMTGISPAIAAAALLVLKVWDSVNDVLFGYFLFDAGCTVSGAMGLLPLSVTNNYDERNFLLAWTGLGQGFGSLPEPFCGEYFIRGYGLFVSYYIFGDANLSVVLSAFAVIPTVILVPFLPAIYKRHDKIKVARFCCIVFAVYEGAPVYEFINGFPLCNVPLL